MIRSMKMSCLLIAGSVCPLMAHAQIELAPVTFRKVIMEGDPAPGLPDGVTIRSLGNLIAINDSGQTAFWAELEGPGVTPQNAYALYSEYGDELHLEHRWGTPMPGIVTPFELASIDSAPRFTDTGRLFAHVGFFTSGGGESDGFVTLRNGVGRLLALRGAPVADLNGAPVATDFDPIIEAAGDYAAVVMDLQGEKDVERSVVRFDPAGAELLLQTGGPAPDAETSLIAGLDVVGIDASGDVGVIASLDDGQGAGAESAAYRLNETTAELVAKSGDPIFGAPEEELVTTVHDPTSGTGVHFDHGMFVGQAMTTIDYAQAPNSGAFFFTSSGGVDLIAQAGDSFAVGPVLAELPIQPFFSRPWSVGENVIGGGGFANLSGGVGFGGPVYLLHDLQSGVTEMPLSTGQPAPLALDASPIHVPYEPCVNDRDRTMMVASHQHVSVLDGRYDLLYVRTEDGELHLRLQPGDQVFFEGEDPRAIALFAPGPAAPSVFGENCYFMAFNNHGQTAQVIEFTDGSRGVFAINLAVSAPDPDLDSNETVDGADLAALLTAWGPCATPFAPCPADLNSDGLINGADLAALLTAWD